jgi:lathosterol oxidase
MAGAGQPWYMPLTWPVGHVLSAASKKGAPLADVAKPTATADLDLIGHLTSFAAATRSFCLACICIYGIHGGADGQGYPAFGAAKSWSWDWMWPLLARNVLGTWIIAGFWDWFLYFSPLKETLRPFKIDPNYPSLRQIKHDAMVTTAATLCGTAIEIALCHYWATGQLRMQRDLNLQTSLTLAWAVTITHWRIPHFWLVHRMMHPWKWESIPKALDPGRWLYKHVHSLHHKSHNPTAFAGTNMHPVEATLYYSAALLPIAFGFTVHPAIPLGCLLDCAIGAWLGHDGFQWPGSGDYFHQLHHKHFDCNFGAMHVPIDKWLGTFAGGKEDVKKIWGKRKSGAEANKEDGFVTHEYSKSATKVE